MRVKDIMTKMVLSVPEETTVEYAAQLMRDHNVGIVPVGDPRIVIGVITDRDVAVRVAAESKDPKHTPVCEVMTKALFYCFDDQDIEDACLMTQDNRVRRLLVFDRMRNLIGILSLDDVVTRARKDKLVGYVLSKVAKPA